MSSAAIRAQIAAVKAKLAKVKKQIEKCNELLKELNTISDDTFQSLFNLKDTLKNLEMGLTIGGKPCGGDNLNERISAMNRFNISTNNAIAKVQAKLAELIAEKEALEQELVALQAALAAALAAEAEAARRAAEAANNKKLTGYRY